MFEMLSAHEYEQLGLSVLQGFCMGREAGFYSMKSIKAKYVVMTNYHIEGWKIAHQTDNFAEAVRERESNMGNGNSEVVIFRPVELVVMEKGGTEEEFSSMTEKPMKFFITHADLQRIWNGCDLDDSVWVPVYMYPRKDQDDMVECSTAVPVELKGDTES